ncbi:FAD-dependent oxidoreductase [Gordonia malaquae]|uniref:FAD-dependent oxidoreductase n=1 Tax=Gordonia malaquae TaxID=410332 RepID=UPI0030FE9A27
MPYLITQNCCADAACVAACPVGCIHPAPGEPGFATSDMLYIDPRVCIDCGACADACPVNAIVSDRALGPDSEPYVAINADHYGSGETYSPVFSVGTAPEPTVTSRDPLRVAVVGSGAAGFYTAKELLRHPGVVVDMYERLDEPHGLVRYGVAPDHPETKRVTEQFVFSPSKAARLTLHSGVEVGVDVSVAELRRRHQAVVLAHGAHGERFLNVDGEGLDGVIGAMSFANWYNGHPDENHDGPPMRSARAVVIGNGNVALDSARMLVVGRRTARGRLAARVERALSTSRISEVVVLGRRGPRDASFTLGELLELAALDDVDLVVENATAAELEPTESDDPAMRRMLEMLGAAARARPSSARRVILRFHTSATGFVGEGAVTGVRIGSGVIDAELVIRAIGFVGTPLDGVDLDPATQTVGNRGGRVIDTAGETVPGLYCVGWIKRGAQGVIGSNRACARETVTALIDDHRAGRLGKPTPPRRRFPRIRQVALR